MLYYRKKTDYCFKIYWTDKVEDQGCSVEQLEKEVDDLANSMKQTIREFSKHGYFPLRRAKAEFGDGRALRQLWKEGSNE